MKKLLIICCLIANYHAYADDDIQNAIEDLSDNAKPAMYITKNENGEVVLTNTMPTNTFDKFTKRIKVEYVSPLDNPPNVKIGMTKAQVRERTTWGKPYKVTKTTDAYGAIETWHYGVSKMLVFKNGILSIIYE